MNTSVLVVYSGAVIVLWLKFLISIVVQARERHSSSGFRYAEDAACWGGEVSADSELCARAQSLLRNDSEGQPHFLILGLLYWLVDASPIGAYIYFPAYAASRLAHAYFLLKPRQPHRTRAFGAGVLLVTILAFHVGFAGASSAGRNEVGNWQAGHAKQVLTA